MATLRVPVKSAAEEMVWELMAPEVMRPVLREVEKRLVLDAVVEKRLVVVAEVPVALVKIRLGNVLLAVVVAVKFAPTTSPTTESFA